MNVGRKVFQYGFVRVSNTLHNFEMKSKSVTANFRFVSNVKISSEEVNANMVSSFVTFRRVYTKFLTHRNKNKLSVPSQTTELDEINE